MFEIIPALRIGPEHPLVKIEIDKINYEDRNLDRSPKFEGLETLIGAFDDKFSITSIGKEFAILGGVLIKQPQTSDYRNKKFWDYWDFVRLFELLLTRNCFEYVTNFGLRYGCLNLFTEIEDDVGMKLITVLSTRGNYWKHSGGGWSEGIHGWLNNEETKVFSSVVDKIKPHKNYLDDEKLTIKLNSLKMMIKEASRLNKGVLWGADLKILYSINWRNKELGTVVRVNDDVKNCLNSAKEEDGEIVKF